MLLVFQIPDITGYGLITNMNAEMRQESLSFLPFSSEENASHGSYWRQSEI